MRRILVVEDGTEYLDFFRLFLGDEYEYVQARNGAEALSRLSEEEVDLIVMDMRFERCPVPDLFGELDQVANEYFGGDVMKATRYLEDNQGTYIVAAIREAGHDQPVLFVSDMPARKMANLRRLYGDLRAVPNFDAAAIGREIREALGEKES